MLDKLGVEVSMPLYVRLDDTKTLAQVLTDANLLGQQLDPISDSQITDFEVRIKNGSGVSGGKSSPAATAENERTGLFNFSQSTSPYKFGIDVPSIADSKIVNGKIDLANADIAAFIAAMIAAGTAATPESTSLYTLLALLDALLTFRKHRRAESRRSFEVA